MITELYSIQNIEEFPQPAYDHYTRTIQATILTLTGVIIITTDFLFLGYFDRVPKSFSREMKEKEKKFNNKKLYSSAAGSVKYKRSSILSIQHKEKIVVSV